jgi:Tfp pilus assembly protein PilN
MITTTTRTGFTQVNLLPPENRERQQTRRTTRIVAVAGSALVGVLVFFAFVQGARVSDLRDKVSQQAATNAGLQARVATLQPYAVLRQSFTSRQTLEHTALAGDISWSNILHELSGAVPPDVWLTSISGTTTPPQSVAAGSGTPSTSTVGSISFQGDAIDTGGVVSWLRSLVHVPGWVNAWVSSAQKTAVGSTNVWQFSSSVDLDKGVVSPRARGAK